MNPLILPSKPHPFIKAWWRWSDVYGWTRIGNILTLPNGNKPRKKF